MSEVCIFFADGLEEIEGLTVVDMLRRAGIDISIVSIMGSTHIMGAHQIGIEADALFEEMDFDPVRMFVLPGGLPGTTHLAEYEPLGRLLTQAADGGKELAAICAAPSVLGKLGLLKGRRATSYPGWEKYLTGALCQTDRVVIDGQFITSRGMGTAIEFSAALIDRLRGPGEGARIMEAIMFM